MATVYSLICWGGRTGKAVTLTVASPCVVTSTNHGLRDGTGLVFSTTGTLPTGITAGTTYYVRSTAANTFNLYDTEAHAKDTAATTGRINTSGTQSGTHTAKSARMIDYFAQYAGRWGASGSERCYDGLVSWNSARSAASALDGEVCEIGQAFYEYCSRIFINVPAGFVRIETKIDSQRTEAFHNGSVGAGYIVARTDAQSNTTFILQKKGMVINGFTVRIDGGGYSPEGISIGALCRAVNMIAIGRYDGNGIGFAFGGQYCECINCLALGWRRGYTSDGSYVNFSAYNCISTLNTYGFQSDNTNSIYGSFINNIFVGNTTNYQTVSDLQTCMNNAGVSGDTPYGTNPITMATTDFADFANKDFRPALSTSPQVDSGVEYYGALGYDITDAERPNYNNGGAEAFDIGCYEYDHGYGDHPATSHISLTNIVSGSRVLITRDDTSAVLYNDVPGASLNLETGYIGNFTVRIRKGSASPVYREFTAGGTTVADQTTSIKVLQQLDE